MALLMLSEDQHRSVFSQLCNVLDPRVAVDFSSASRWLRVPTQALRRQLRAEYEAAAALCRKMGMRSCKHLREARLIRCFGKVLFAADLTRLGSLGLLLPALESLGLCSDVAPPYHATEDPDGVQWLAAGLGAGALPSVDNLFIALTLGGAGALAFAAALGRGALPRLESLTLCTAGIDDAGLVALAPALRRLPLLRRLILVANPFGDEGLAALVAPPPPVGAPPPPTDELTKLKELDLTFTQISDAGCATLAAAIDSDVLPALKDVNLDDTPASAAAKGAVTEALETSLERLWRLRLSVSSELTAPAAPAAADLEPPSAPTAAEVSAQINILRRQRRVLQINYLRESLLRLLFGFGLLISALYRVFEDHEYMWFPYQ